MDKAYYGWLPPRAKGANVRMVSDWLSPTPLKAIPRCPSHCVRFIVADSSSDHTLSVLNWSTLQSQHPALLWSKAVPPFPVPEGRRSKRVAMRRPASLVLSRGRHEERFPCLIVDSSQEGFRLLGDFQLKRGQIVEVIPNDDPLNVIQCSVVWIGKEGSKQEREVGVQIVA